LSPRSLQSKPAAARQTGAAPARGTTTLSFDDNRLLMLVFGEHDEHLLLIEDRLGVDVTPRGNKVAIQGTQGGREMARQVLVDLYERALEGLELGRGDVEGAIRMAMVPMPVSSGGKPEVASVRTRRKVVTARSPGQKTYLEAIAANELVFGVGPAGTGKTYLAVVCAAADLMAGKVDRIILSRPAVEAGERLGFLPGDMKEKVDPYLRPLYDALYDVMPAEAVIKGMADNTIEIAPLAFMRGRTLSRAFVILDEAQNTTPQQMKMFLTRLGEGSRMVITGDPTQVDLPAGITSGLTQALDYLKGVDGIAQVKFGNADIVRHPLVTKIVDAYDRAGWEPADKPRKP
jgi:phosphate starvation-inducible PhoH-like protein